MPLLLALLLAAPERRLCRLEACGALRSLRLIERPRWRGLTASHHQASEERQADAFNSVIRQMAEDLQRVTQERDEAWARLATLDKSGGGAHANRTSSAAGPSAAQTPKRSNSFERRSAFASRFRTGIGSGN